MTEQLSNLELLQRLTLLASTRAAFPDSLKQTLWEVAEASNPENPLAAYLEELFKSDQFISDLLKEPR
jgi:hypothetical protein